MYYSFGVLTISFIPQDHKPFEGKNSLIHFITPAAISQGSHKLYAQYDFVWLVKLQEKKAGCEKTQWTPAHYIWSGKGGPFWLNKSKDS